MSRLGRTSPFVLQKLLDAVRSAVHGEAPVTPASPVVPQRPLGAHVEPRPQFVLQNAMTGC